MRSFRYLAYFLASACCLVAIEAPSSPLLPIDDNFRALTQNDHRVFGLDYAGTVWSSDDAGDTFDQAYQIAGDSNDTYYTLLALENTVMTVGTDALMARSGNDGSEWDATVNTNYIQGDLKALAARAGTTTVENQWIAVGHDGDQGVVFRSLNDGINWERYDAGTLFADIEFSGAIWTGSAWLICGLKSQIEIGATDYSGVIFRSLDGTTWSLVSDAYAAPVRAIASNAAGEVLAVGERGLVLRSTDDGLSFQRIDGSSFSEDLSSVTADSRGRFIIGGDGKSVLESTAGTLSIIRPAAGGAPGVEALLEADGAILLSGAFLSTPRTLPFNLRIEMLGNYYRLTVDEALSGKVYTLETSTVLEGWEAVPGKTDAGYDSSLSWVLPADGLTRFWRVTEF
ncbi:hypothetical protein QEH59_12055 [Coraliomargarita sp. SDUM461004]|uniref:Photosynthesis system II assembly factor Ycf48/Hcf136-like domain-containing protein n=1 Tax=Thalassobacterium sedimentorum TaxID=3041258 RepID=A0ABU1AK53_9BACT|nr:hypothetical protein [Coraliomargarita sp. SDUM461004]MDQ8195163.1 hypothetical protein [Coraliomargarita sp. SDUM461004]